MQEVSSTLHSVTTTAVVYQNVQYILALKLDVSLKMHRDP